MKPTVAINENPAVPVLPQRSDKPMKVGRKEHIDARLVCLLQPESAAAESYSRLRHAVETLRTAERGIVIGVTSASRGEGKTLTAINLAGALAQNPAASVLLVDLDLRRPEAGIRQYLDLRNSAAAGIADWISNPQLDNEQLTHCLTAFNLCLVTAGTTVKTPYELLKSPRLDEFLQQARQRFQYIIVDMTHVLQLPDTQLLSRVVDGFLLVVRADCTTTGMLDDSLNLMQRDKVLGLVFNGDSSPR